MPDIRSVFVHIQAKDQTAPGLRAAEGALKKFEGEARTTLATLRDLTIAFVGVRAAVNLVTSAIFGSVRAFEESQQASIRLGISFKALGGNAEKATKDTLAFAAALSKTTRFTDEQIAGAASLLAALRGLSGAGLERATRAAADLAEFMEVDIRTAARLIARAEEASGAFTRLGIVLKEGEEPLQVVERLMGGVAERIGKTAASTSQAAKAWGEFSESVGRAISPVVTPFLQMSAKAADALAGAVEEANRQLREFARTRETVSGRPTPTMVAAPVVPEMRGIEDRLAVLRQLQAEFAATSRRLLPEIAQGIESSFQDYQRLQENLRLVKEEIDALTARLAPSRAAVAEWGQVWDDLGRAIEKFGLAGFVEDLKKVAPIVAEQQTLWGQWKATIVRALDDVTRAREQAEEAARKTSEAQKKMLAEEADHLQRYVRRLKEWSEELREIHALRQQAAAFRTFETAIDSISRVTREAVEEVEGLEGLLALGVLTEERFAAASEEVESALRRVNEVMAMSSTLAENQRKTLEATFMALRGFLESIPRRMAKVQEGGSKLWAEQRKGAAEFKREIDALTSALAGPFQRALVDALSGTRMASAREWANAIGRDVRRGLATAISGPFLEKVFKPLGETLAGTVQPALAPLAEGLRATVKPFADVLRTAVEGIVAPFASLLSAAVKPVADLFGAALNAVVEPFVDLLGSALKALVKEIGLEKALVGAVTDSAGGAGGGGTAAPAAGGGGGSVTQTISTVVAQPVGGIALQSVTTLSSMIVAALAGALITSASVATFVSGVTLVAAAAIPAIVVAGDVGVVIIGAIGAVGAFVTAGLVSAAIIGYIGEVTNFNAENALVLAPTVNLPRAEKGDTIYFQQVGFVGEVGRWLSLFTNANVQMVGFMAVVQGTFLVALVPQIAFGSVVNIVRFESVGTVGAMVFGAVINVLTVKDVGTISEFDLGGGASFVQLLIGSVRHITIEKASLGGGLSIPGFQAGGIVKRDTLAFVHAGEEVVAREDRTLVERAVEEGGGGPIQVSVTINAAGGDLRDEAVVRRVSREIGREIERRIRRPGRGR